MSKSKVFILRTRATTDSDLGIHNFPPDHEEYEVYLNALRDERAMVAGISSSKLQDSTIVIETATPFDVIKLQKLIKSVFTEEIIKRVKFISLQIEL